MITLKNISKSVGEKILFENISFKLGEGQKVGLVGPNGVGKTTFLNIILGETEPDSGSVIVSNETLGYLPQKLLVGSNEEVGQYLLSFLKQKWEVHTVDTVLARVGLTGMNKKTLIAKLSGGQKMKVVLASILLTEPTTLVLDEPTNNLDAQSLDWLEKFVKNFDGKILLVSHDRYFLDACVNKIVELDQFSHKIAEYGGNYSSYKEQKSLNQQNQLSDYKRQQGREKHMREWISQKQQQLTHHPSTKVARQLQAMKTRFEREIVRDQLDKPVGYKSFSAGSLGNQLHKGKACITIQDFQIHDLLTIPTLVILGQERIQLLGSNGSGKTTLLKSILGQEKFYTGSIEIGNAVSLGYYSQEHEVLNPQESVLDAFMRQTNLKDESRARSTLGKFLFSKQHVFSQIKNLSEGEKARLLIAMIMHQGNDFLLLDEPTNHLDLESREVLAQALKEYEGGFLVVSHDRYFIQEIGIERTLTIRGQKVESEVTRR